VKLFRLLKYRLRKYDHDPESRLTRELWRMRMRMRMDWNRIEKSFKDAIVQRAKDKLYEEHMRGGYYLDQSTGQKSDLPYSHYYMP
jgi:hypothetical protein